MRNTLIKKIAIALAAGTLTFTVVSSAFASDGIHASSKTQNMHEVRSCTEKKTDAEVEPGCFTYEHDPRLNPSAMADIVENPDAIYGFSPDPESKRLGEYADYDWSDAEVVEKGRQDRIAYHESLESMYMILHEMRDKGSSIEEMARAVSEERNRLRLESYKDDPEGLKKVKQSNLETYGDENGPSADSLFEKYGSWETVLQKAFGTNAGMDACVGLYDTYYTLYIELGMIQE